MYKIANIFKVWAREKSSFVLSLFFLDLKKNDHLEINLIFWFCVKIHKSLNYIVLGHCISFAKDNRLFKNNVIFIDISGHSLKANMI